MRVILASKSPARLTVLRRAGLDPEVMISGYDEDQVQDPVPSRLAERLAIAKGEFVLPQVEGDFVLLACDSVLEFEAKAHGKPGSADAAIERWRRMRGKRGILHTGHYVVVANGGDVLKRARVRSTVVQFADLSDAEIEAYAATGEPQRVAGGFTIDGRGGAFVTAIHGDPYNVVGVSLPLFRQMVIDAGVPWESLWSERRA